MIEDNLNKIQDSNQLKIVASPKKKNYIVIIGFILIILIILIVIYIIKFNKNEQPAKTTDINNIQENEKEPIKPIKKQPNKMSQEEFEKQQKEIFPCLGNRELNMDIDRDKILGCEEVYIYNTDPNNPDTDGDGFLDGDEIRNGYNPLGEGKLIRE